ncbi:MAG TPA: response regulator [Abditibacteriaceae bacterium]|nr:response regulator [Abditibacteriaceae bacterium]
MNTFQTSETKYQVLLIEDDPHITRLIEANLSKAKMGFLSATNGRAGLQILQQRAVDLVLLDLMLPDMTGYEVCQKIRETSNVPIIMATARDQPEDQMHGLKLGADDYVIKPFDPQLLVARVIAQLRRVHRYSAPQASEKDSSTESRIPTGWMKCGDCSYLGPREKFESLNAQFRVVRECPHCAQTVR